ncbi:MAG: dihydroorotate dehydrogenase [Candidatus Omnitrophica bacterium]|nr:dihydroorotate dehydrogenase [Candidatus Omnitrophota bacterium]
MGVKTSVRIGKLKLKNPVMAASGTFGVEYQGLVDISALGAIVMKTITLKPREGNPPPRIVETASGMLNSIGLENVGLDKFIEEKLPEASVFKAPIIASVSGDSDKDFAEMARRLDKTNIDGIELNLSCPNLRKKRLISQSAGDTYKAVKAARRETALTLIAKLSPNVTDISEIVQAACNAGADAVSLVNTFTGMAVDIQTGRPRLGAVTGGLSGPAIKPIALRMVWEAFNKVKIPIIGIGGIMDYRDALEFIICGATAVQIGTANFVNPGAAIEIIKGIKKYLADNDLESIKGIIGGLRWTN